MPDSSDQGDRTATDVAGQAATLEATASEQGAVARVAGSPRPGEHMGRYELLEILGEGGMGVVYRAYDPVLDRELAIKLLRHGAGGNSELQRRLIREAQAMARLSHRNLVTVHDVGTHDRHVFVAMELVDGTTLGEWAEGRSWDERLAALVAAGHGLEEAHGASVIHRDFKPANVLVDRKGRILVADFGLARSTGPGTPATATEAAAFDRASSSPAAATSSSPPSVDSPLAVAMTATGAILGTPAYMPPEQYSGGAVDARADQFSFAVSVYELLYGRRPFAGETLEALIKAVNAGELREPPPDAEPPAEIFEALRPALAARPGDRYESLGALLDALARAGKPPVAKERSGRLALAAALLVGGVFAAVWALSRGPEPAAVPETTEPELPAAPDWARAALESAGEPFADCMAGLREDQAGELVIAVDMNEFGLTSGSQVLEEPLGFNLASGCILKKLSEFRWWYSRPPIPANEPRRFRVRIPLRPVSLAIPGFRRLDSDTVEISRDGFEALIDDPKKFMAKAGRIRVAVEEGQLVGFQFVRVGKDSIPEHVGIEHGDIVTTINGMPLSLDGMLELKQTLRRTPNLREVQLELLRDGEPKTLTVKIAWDGDTAAGP